jgi:hypothetical protein
MFFDTMRSKISWILRLSLTRLQLSFSSMDTLPPDVGSVYHPPRKSEI